MIFKKFQICSYVALILFTGSGSAEETINSLLSELNNDKALYKKTLDESAGISIVYTRHDLDRMQVHTLKDLLKSVRFLSYGEGVVGESVLSPAGGTHPLSSMYRLYIDGHEVSSPIFGSAILQFGEMDLGFVDHIEIYQGGNAIAFGNEPGLMTIRIYSKDPEREGGSTLKLLGDTLKSANAELCYTRTGENGSLLAYLSGGKNRRKEISAHNRNYSKDGDSLTFYGKYRPSEHLKITAAHFRERKDAFAGVGPAQDPGDPNRLSWRHSFLDLLWEISPKTHFDISADLSTHRMEFDDKLGGIRIVGVPTPIKYLDAEFHERVFKASLKGDLDHSGGQFTWGAEGIQKGYSIGHITVDDRSLTQQKGPSRLTILSLYGEEKWNATPQDLFIGTVKGDYLRTNLSREDFETSMRFGWIHAFTLENSFKLFYNRTYLYPGFGYTSTYPKIFEPNPDLGAEHVENLIAEWKLERKKYQINLGGLWQRKKDSIIIDEVHRTFVNSPQSFSASKLYIDYVYHFDTCNKIAFEYYQGWLFDGLEVRSPLSGGYLRLFNTFGKWDLFNELVYRSGYTFPMADRYGGPIRIKNGWDYTLGIQWHPRHDITLSIKGENLFNSALESPVYGFGAVPVFDRKVTVGLEYFF